MNSSIVNLLLLSLASCASQSGEAQPIQEGERRLLYVAVPGIRNYLEWGGAGVLVYDIDRGHALVKRIPTNYMDEKDPPGKAPENVKGVCASAATGRLYVTTLTRLACIDLTTEKQLWVRRLPGGTDRMSISPDGTNLYVPSLEGPHWNVVDAMTGDLIAQVITNSGAHNTVYGADGKKVYLGGLKSNNFLVAETGNHTVAEAIPCSAPVRPFTVNRAQTLAFVNVNGLLGFEVVDLKAGKMIQRMEVPGFKQGPIKRHGCPSHGVGLTPDEKEVWCVDAANQQVHVYDATSMPPRYVQSIALQVDQPGWVTFSIRGDFGYPSTGEIVDPATKKIVAQLKDENGKPVQSEKMVEVDWKAGKVVRCGDQFGVGRR